jgi:hypothetical protein
MKLTAQLDYPSIDQPLIMALMSDYEPSALLAKLPEIREQLGILEASLVPDTDNSYIPDTSHDNDEDLVQTTSSLSLGVKKKGGKRRKSPLSGTASTSDSGLKSGRSANSQSTTTSPTSETEGEGEDGEAYLDELELLGELFPTV